MPYHNAKPHRLNGPRESVKFNSIDGELFSLEKKVLNLVNTLLLSIEENKENLSLASLSSDQE